jgi:hypothetical protein
MAASNWLQCKAEQKQAAQSHSGRLLYQTMDCCAHAPSWEVLQKLLRQHRMLFLLLRPPYPH